MENHILKFLQLWTSYGERIANKMRENPTDREWRKVTNAAMRKLKDFLKYKPTTMQNQMACFGKEQMGAKVNGRRRRQINVQPTTLSRSKIRRRGKRAVGFTGKVKDRSRETERFILDDGEEKY